mgnify:CR=1 FL=1
MARLYSYDHQDALIVPDEEVDEKIASGKYSFLEGERVHVLDEKNQIYNLPAKDARRALESGYRFATGPIVEERRLREFVQSRPSEAAMFGFLRSMSFSLSDDLLQRAGVDERAIKMLREEHPGYSIAGELGGLFTPGGLTGAAASLAGKVGSKAVGKILGDRAAGLVGKTIHGATRGAAEGAVIGTQQYVSRAILDDPDQRPLAAQMIGASAGFGGVAGGLISVIGHALSKASPLLGKGKDYAYYRHLKARSPEYDYVTKRGRYRERIYEIGKRLRELDKQKLTETNVKELDKLVIELEEKLLPHYGGEISRILKEIAKAQKDLGREVADEMFDPVTVSARMRREILDKELNSGKVLSPTARRGIKQAEREIAAFEAAGGKLDMLESEVQKRIYQKLANYRKNTDPEKFDLFQKMAYIIREESENALGRMEKKLGDRLGNKALLQEFKEAKNIYRDLADIHYLSASATRRADVNNIFSLTTFLTGGSFGAAGPLILGTESAVTGGLSAVGSFAAGALARKFLKDNGMLLLGRVGNSISDYGKLLNNVGITTERIRRGANKVVQGLEVAGLSTNYPVPKTPAVALQQFRKQRNQLNEIMRDEQSLFVRLQEAVPAIPTANPDLTQYLQSTIVRGLTFLYENIPTDPNAGHSVVFDPDKYNPSNQQLMDWQAYNEIINSPLAILRHISRGSLTPEHVRTLSQVYPDLYRYMQDALLKAMAVRSPKIRLPQEVSLSTFVQQPIGAGMAHISGFQQTFRQPEGQGLQRRTNKVQDLDRLIKTPMQGVA